MTKNAVASMAEAMSTLIRPSGESSQSRSSQPPSSMRSSAATVAPMSPAAVPIMHHRRLMACSCIWSGVDAMTLLYPIFAAFASPLAAGWINVHLQPAASDDANSIFPKFSHFPFDKRPLVCYDRTVALQIYLFKESKS